MRRALVELVAGMVLAVIGFSYVITSLHASNCFEYPCLPPGNTMVAYLWGGVGFLLVGLGLAVVGVFSLPKTRVANHPLEG
jgi:hypothetical protein